MPKASVWWAVACVGALVPLQARAAMLSIDTVTVSDPRQTAVACLRLDTEGQEIAGVQNEIVWDESCVRMSGRCRATGSHGKTLNSARPPGTSGVLRAFLLSFSDVDPIPDGELYCCEFTLNVSQPGASCPLRLQNVLGSDPTGRPISLAVRNGRICLGECPGAGSAGALRPREGFSAPAAEEEAPGPERPAGPAAGPAAEHERSEPPLRPAARPAPPAAAGAPPEEPSLAGTAGGPAAEESRGGPGQQPTAVEEPAESPGAAGGETEATTAPAAATAAPAASPRRPSPQPERRRTAPPTRRAVQSPSPRPAAKQARAAEAEQESGCTLAAGGARAGGALPLLLGIAVLLSLRRRAR